MASDPRHGDSRLGGPGRDRREPDDDLTAGPPPFSDEGMRRIVYGDDRRMVAEALKGHAPDSRSAAFAEDTAELEASLRRRRSLVPIVTAAAAVVCFGAIVWYAYDWGTGQVTTAELPVVHADATPEKVKPAQPGGMNVPYQDKLVLNDGTPEGGAPKVERLLPPPEVPQPPPVTAPQQQAAAPGPVEQPTQPPADQPPEAPLAGSTAEAPAKEGAEPLSEALAPGAEAPESPAETAEAEIAKPVPKPDISGQHGQDEIAALIEKEPLETAAGKPDDGAQASPAPAAPTQTAALSPGDVVLQLASVTSEAAATREWARMQKAYPALLGKLPLSIDTAEVKGTKYYRVQTGPFPSRSAAADLCTQLKARKQDCLVKHR